VRDWPPVYEALVAAWRETRAVEIADVLDRLDGYLPAESASIARDHDAWLARAATRDAVHLAGLLATVTIAGSLVAKERLQALVGWSDPRIPRAIARWLADPPFVGQQSRRFWTQAVTLLGSVSEHRAAVAARALEGRLARIFGHAIGSIGRSLEVKLGRSLPVLESDLARVSRRLGRVEATTCNAIADELGRAAPAGPPATATTAEEFLRAIIERPDDDGVRLVFADWLLEREDPRGELIALQYAKRARALGASEARREGALLKTYQRTWLGELANYTRREGRVFERGFLARCTTRFRSARDHERAIGAAGWATVEAIRGGHAALLVHPVMRSLREVRGVSADVGIAFATDPAAPPVNVLEVDVYGWRSGSAALARALVETPLLRALRRLELRLARTDESRETIRQIATSELATRLESLHVTLAGPLALDPDFVLDLASATCAIPSLSIGDDSWRYQLRLGPDQRRSLLEVERAIDRARIDRVIAVLARLPSDQLVQLAVRDPLTDAANRAVSDAVTRQTRLTELQLASREE
jgi:uncharacterized protein (TIGR02996 family)